MDKATSDQDLLRIVADLLERGQPQQALEAVNRAGTASREARNARGVCLLRLGATDKALQIFRQLVLEPNGVAMLPGGPLVYKTNLATALLLSRNVSGCQSVLREIHSDSEPPVRRLHEAIARWKRSLNLVERLWFALYHTVPKDKPILPPDPPGDLRDPGQLRPAA